MQVFSDMEEHKQNIERYLQLGGESKLAHKHRIPTLENRAKISYLLSKISKPEQKISGVKIQESTPKQIKQETPKPSKPKGLGIIAQYPVELHSAYQEAVQIWINLCSLKIQLNAVPEDDEKSAFEIQTDMLKKIQIFDKCKSALDHYNENKRILATETKSDFSKLSAMQTLNKRNSLRSNISRRKQTIEKMEAELPEESAPDYYKKLSAVNRKKEQLQEKILEEEKLNELIK